MMVFVKDKHGKRLRGATLHYSWDGNKAEIQIGDFDPDITIPAGTSEVKFEAYYPNAGKVERRALAGDHESILQFDNFAAPIDYPSWAGLVLIGAATVLTLACIAVAFISQAVATFAFGILFIITLLSLAFVFPTPTPIQHLVVRVVLALAAAGVAAMLPGFLELTIPNYLKAGGSLAVFVLIYLRSPANLIANAREG